MICAMYGVPSTEEYDSGRDASGQKWTSGPSVLARRGIPFPPPLRKAQLLSISLSFSPSLSYSFLQRYPGCLLVLLGSIPPRFSSADRHLYRRTLFLIPLVLSLRLFPITYFPSRTPQQWLLEGRPRPASLIIPMLARLEGACTWLK